MVGLFTGLVHKHLWATYGVPKAGLRLETSTVHELVRVLLSQSKRTVEGEDSNQGHKYMRSYQEMISTMKKVNQDNVIKSSYTHT